MELVDSPMNFQSTMMAAQSSAEKQLGEEGKPKIVKETETQDNIVEIEINIESDVDGGIDIDKESINGHLVFM